MIFHVPNKNALNAALILLQTYVDGILETVIGHSGGRGNLAKVIASHKYKSFTYRPYPVPSGAPERSAPDLPPAPQGIGSGASCARDTPALTAYCVLLEHAKRNHVRLETYCHIYGVATAGHMPPQKRGGI